MYHYGGSTGPGRAARVRSVRWRGVQARAGAFIIRRILMKQQNPIENQCVGGKCHRPLYICHYVLPFSTSNSWNFWENPRKMNLKNVLMRVCKYQRRMGIPVVTSLPPRLILGTVSAYFGPFRRVDFEKINFSFISHLGVKPIAIFEIFVKKSFRMSWMSFSAWLVSGAV